MVPFLAVLISLLMIGVVWVRHMSRGTAKRRRPTAPQHSLMPLAVLLQGQHEISSQVNINSVHGYIHAARRSRLVCAILPCHIHSPGSLCKQLLSVLYCTCVPMVVIVWLMLRRYLLLIVEVISACRGSAPHVKSFGLGSGRTCCRPRMVARIPAGATNSCSWPCVCYRRPWDGSHTSC